MAKRYRYKGREISKWTAHLIVIGFISSMVFAAGFIYLLACGMAALG